ncbi:D-alanyl-D-alanine carboxypeptidase family protein [Paenibacillus aurantius]|uniref:D-alanyl-D-alanine carboxypeptidase family protein n=1 Tax=Paenibacillus aurantius TaxID=2918900 RepID=A0AA96RI28_9BACL|nr:D-alanyl-D-alanine carboxypeptidase family protein [Paenibacillus aurantius]WNQ14171.1 D-alanyl-D-alanine carboxypeptidase family protein [Paenibacillus aurantius]
MTHSRKIQAFLLAAGLTAVLAGCEKDAAGPAPTASASASANPSGSPQVSPSPAPASSTSTPGSSAPASPAGETKPSASPTAGPTASPTGKPTAKPTDKPSDKPAPEGTVTAKPDSIAVLINKQSSLPDGYRPPDLVEPNVPFIFKEKNEKRLMRKEAAGALEKLFAGARKDGVLLGGVSGFRSYETQTVLFNNYVKQHGEAEARKFSAFPGQSEHQTGLSIDVSGSTGKCAAEDCFGGTKEADWLAAHAQDYGFIIRYPKGKEAITGYQYEPWHIRYVGTTIAREITAKGITLEEYYGAAVPVTK